MRWNRQPEGEKWRKQKQPNGLKRESNESTMSIGQNTVFFISTAFYRLNNRALWLVHFWCRMVPNFPEHTEVCDGRFGECSAQKGANPFGANAFGAHQTKNTMPMTRHRLSCFSFTVHPKSFRQKLDYFWDRTLAWIIHALSLVKLWKKQCPKVIKMVVLWLPYKD